MTTLLTPKYFVGFSQEETSSMSTKVTEAKVDFETLCSCEKCISKIKYLKDFDEFLVSQQKVVRVCTKTNTSSYGQELLSIFRNCQQQLPAEDFLLDAEQSIKRTFREMKKVKRAFWAFRRKNNEMLLDKGHMNGLSTTLHLLTEKAAAFYAEWEYRFAPFLPSSTPQPCDNELEETSMPTEGEAKVEDLSKGWSFDLSSCNLFPPDFDLEKVCSCQECISKINYLKDFEGFMLSIYKLIMVILMRYRQASDHCDYISMACDWSESTLDSFLFSLKEVTDELGEEFTDGGRCLKHKIEKLKLNEFLVKVGVYPNYDVPAAQLLNQTTDPAEDIDFDIGSRGMHYYERTKVREEGQNLLKKILQIEAEYQNAKKSAADNGKSLHPSVSKDFILQQIKCLEKLPVKGLRTEAEACIAKLSDIFPEKWNMVGGAKSSILRTCKDMVVVTTALWRKIENNKGDIGHELTTGYLDLLKEKAEAFKIVWENSFAGFYPTPTDQPRDN